MKDCILCNHPSPPLCFQVVIGFVLKCFMYFIAVYNFVSHLEEVKGGIELEQINKLQRLHLSFMNAENLPTLSDCVGPSQVKDKERQKGSWRRTHKSPTITFLLSLTSPEVRDSVYIERQWLILQVARSSLLIKNNIAKDSVVGGKMGLFIPVSHQTHVSHHHQKKGKDSFSRVNWITKLRCCKIVLHGGLSHNHKIVARPGI